MTFEGCALCACKKELEIIGDPMEQVPDRVWEVLRDAALLERGLPVMPEVGAWGDQPAAWCSLIEYVMAERARMKSEAEELELGRLMG